MSTHRQPRVAFVVQRCGKEVIGGAESLCLQIAQLMARDWRVDVLTTRAYDYMTWADHYPAGDECIDDVTVKRFAVDAPRDVDAFNRLSEQLVATKRRPAEMEERWMRAQGPISSALQRHIVAHERDYDAFFFFTYLYATTYYGLPSVSSRAVLVPAAHDEWPIYNGMWDKWFRQVRYCVFNTPEEQQFLQKRLKRKVPGTIAGMYVLPPAKVDHAAFRREHGIKGPFVFYLGRLDGSKNVPDLLRHFAAYRAKHGKGIELVLAGPLVMDWVEQDGVHYVGKIDEAAKWSALAAAEALMMPSQHESLSLVCLEAWAMGTPALVNAHSGPLRGQVERSGGGRSYTDEASFCSSLATMLAEQATSAAQGASGRRYVDDAYSPRQIAARYQAAFEAVAR